ncbi:MULTISPECIES: hypothetical protein [unclassified Bradyrhizobium]
MALIAPTIDACLTAWDRIMAIYPIDLLKWPCAAIFLVQKDGRLGALPPQVPAKERNAVPGRDRDRGIVRIDRRRRDLLSCLDCRSKANRR